MIKLNAFAHRIGISNVYLSYIETNKRPAPSMPILQNMEKALTLESEESALFYSLAVLSHSKSDFPSDILNYINSRPYVLQSLQKALEHNAGEEDWATFRQMLD